jgi:hypothetical protein
VNKLWRKEKIVDKKPKSKKAKQAKPIVEGPSDILCADCFAICTLSLDGKRWLCPNGHN